VTICLWCLPIYFILLLFPIKGMRANNRFPEGSRGVITISSVRQRDPIPQCHWSRGIRFSGVNDTADPMTRCNWSGGLIDTEGSNPAASVTPLNPLPRSHWDYEIFYKNVQVGSRGVFGTEESEFCQRLPRFSRRIRSPLIRALNQGKNN
jgi:hypothetical protein